LFGIDMAEQNFARIRIATPRGNLSPAEQVLHS
jgi:hypothetical protein